MKNTMIGIAGTSRRRREGNGNCKMKLTKEKETSPMPDYDREITTLPEDKPGYDRRPEWQVESDRLALADYYDRNAHAAECEEK